MPRKKKTREEKKKADLRNLHAAAQPSFVTPTYSFSASSHESLPTSAPTPTLFVTNDLRKTAIVSFAILLAQLLFFYLLSHHMLAIGFVRY